MLEKLMAVINWIVAMVKEIAAKLGLGEVVSNLLGKFSK